MFNDKQCRSRSVGFFRSQLISIYTVCKGRVYLGSAAQGLNCQVVLVWCFSVVDIEILLLCNGSTCISN